MLNYTGHNLDFCYLGSHDQDADDDGGAWTVYAVIRAAGSIRTVTVARTVTVSDFTIELSDADHWGDSEPEAIALLRDGWTVASTGTPCVVSGAVMYAAELLAQTGEPGETAIDDWKRCEDAAEESWAAFQFEDARFAHCDIYAY